MNKCILAALYMRRFSTCLFIHTCLDVQPNSRADSLTPASFLSRSVNEQKRLVIRGGCNVPGLALPLRVLNVWVAGKTV